MAGVSAGVVGFLERGRADRLSVSSVRAVARALDVVLRWETGYRGAELARLRDADHSGCAELVARRLNALDWVTRAEVSFNHYGDRGRIDLVAYHPLTSTLLVIEIKTVIADVQGVLGSLDVKERVAPAAARPLGLRPRHVAAALVAVESTTNRRRLASHPLLFARFGLRGRQAAAWLRHPRPAGTALLLLVKLPDRNVVSGRRAGRQRVRLQKVASHSAEHRVSSTAHPDGA